MFRQYEQRGRSGLRMNAGRISNVEWPSGCRPHCFPMNTILIRLVSLFLVSQFTACTAESQYPVPDFQKYVGHDVEFRKDVWVYLHQGTFTDLLSNTWAKPRAIPLDQVAARGMLPGHWKTLANLPAGTTAHVIGIDYVTGEIGRAYYLTCKANYLGKAILFNYEVYSPVGGTHDVVARFTDEDHLRLK